MTISVLVPAYNEAQGLTASLASIRQAMQAFTARGWAVQLVVCDNNSSDDTAAIAAAAGAAVVFEPVNQIARARNRAAAAATGDWLVFVDADSHPTLALFQDAAEWMASGRCLAGGSVVRMDAGPWPAQLMVGVWNVTSRVMRWAAGAFVFVEARAFREVGGFSERLYATEEIELFGRLKRLARRDGRRIAILRRHPLVTSGRKLRLYRWWEFGGMLARTVLSGGRSLRRADACFVWYDGRR